VLAVAGVAWAATDAQTAAATMTATTTTTTASDDAYSWASYWAYWERMDRSRFLWGVVFTVVSSVFLVQHYTASSSQGPAASASSATARRVHAD